MERKARYYFRIGRISYIISKERFLIQMSSSLLPNLHGVYYHAMRMFFKNVDEMGGFIFSFPSPKIKYHFPLIQSEPPFLFDGDFVDGFMEKKGRDVYIGMYPYYRCNKSYAQEFLFDRVTNKGSIRNKKDSLPNKSSHYEMRNYDFKYMGKKEKYFYE